MTYSGLEHIAIAAKDTDALADWYCKAFGFTVAYKNQRTPPTYFVKLGSSLIELIAAGETPRQARDQTDPGWSHLAVSVDDFDAAVADLKKKGIEVGDIREAGGGVKVGWLKDIEGNLLQIIRRPTPL